MYIVDFAKSLFRKANITIVIYLVLNIALYISLLGMFTGDVLTAVAVGIPVYLISLCLALSPVGEWLLRRQSGCKKIKRQEDIDRIMPLFYEVYDQARAKDSSISSAVKLYMSEDSEPNAFATGRKTVCMTRGMMAYPDMQIKGTLAHEFAHLAHKDTDLLLLITVGNFLMTTLFIVYRVIFTFFIGVIGSVFNARSIGQLIKTLVIDIMLVFAMNLWTKLGTLLCLRAGRENEYEADKFAHELGYGDELCGVLASFGTGGEKKGVWATLHSTHPETDDRIGRLQGYGASFGLAPQVPEKRSDAPPSLAKSKGGPIPFPTQSSQPSGMAALTGGGGGGAPVGGGAPTGGGAPVSGGAPVFAKADSTPGQAPPVAGVTPGGFTGGQAAPVYTPPQDTSQTPQYQPPTQEYQAPPAEYQASVSQDQVAPVSRFQQVSETPAELPQETTPEGKSCKNCGSWLESAAMFCVSCATHVDSFPCLGCNKPLNPGAKFCTECGTKVEEAPPVVEEPQVEEVPPQEEPQIASAPDGAVCTGCGNQLKPDALFCTNCGTKTADAVPATDAAPVVETPVAEAPPQEEQQDDPDSWVCPVCESKLGSDVLVCPYCTTHKGAVPCSSCGAILNPGESDCFACKAPVGAVNCTGCGNPLKPDALFCTSCGTKVEAAPVAEEPPQDIQQADPVPDINACVSCGSQLKPGALFCTSCGTKTADTAPAPSPEPDQSPDEAQSQNETYEPEPAVTAEVTPPPAPPVPPQVQIPEGFTLDTSSGLYYQQVPGADPNTGAPGRWITWFYPETGQYQQQFYPN